MAQKQIRKIKVWFDKVLKMPTNGNDLSIEKRKAKALILFKKLLKERPRGEKWEIFHVFWELHDRNLKLLRATVLIKQRPPGTGGPGGDSKVPTPPPSPPASA